MTSASTEQDREWFVLGAMLRRQARLQPDKVFARFEDGRAAVEGRACLLLAPQKDVLRRQGAAGAWDREAAGMVLKRERLS